MNKEEIQEVLRLYTLYLEVKPGGAMANLMEADPTRADLIGANSRKGWELELKFCGIWRVSVIEKNTGRVLAWTGMTSLNALPKLLELPLKEWV